MTAILLPFPHDWSQSLKRRDTWLMNVIAGKNGGEWRAMLRTDAQRSLAPRLVGLPQYLTESILNAIRTSPAQRFLLPMWQDEAYLTADALTGVTSLFCDTTDRAFEVGAEALLVRERDTGIDSEVVTLDGAASDHLTLHAGIAADWLAPSRVVPLWSVVLPDLPAINRESLITASLDGTFVELPDFVGDGLTGNPITSTPDTVAVWAPWDQVGAHTIGAPSMYSGEEIVAEASVLDAAGDLIPGATVTWSTSNASLITVRAIDPLGRVALLTRTGTAGGSDVTITATSGSASGTLVPHAF